MANVMNFDVRNNSVHRSGFDLSFRNCFTAKVGEILPVSVDECIPRDKWSIDLRSFMRTAPVQTASFGRLRQYYDFYFVPYRLLWDKYPAWVVQTANAYHAQSIKASASLSSPHPYLTSVSLQNYLAYIRDTPSYMDNLNDRYYGTRKLLDFLGYGEQTAYLSSAQETALNPFPLLGYQKIYQDFFRFGQWESAAPWTYNLDYIMGDDTEIAVNSIRPRAASNELTMFDLHACNFDKDYYTGMLPSSQFGDEALASPLIGSVAGAFSFTGTSDQGKTASSFLGVSSNNGDQVGLYNPQTRGSETGNFTLQGTGGLTVNQAYLSNPDYVAGIGYLAIRYAEALQKWKEITSCADPDYREQIKRHWNIDVGSDLSYRCQYLGGTASDIDIQGVDNTNLTSSDVVIRGKGLSADNGHIEFECKDYGLLFCIYHAKPIQEYNGSTICPRMLLKTRPTDYAIPEFDSIGLQSVTYGEFTSPASPTAVAGYVPRYAEYKNKVDRVHGAFEGTLSSWTLPFILPAGVGGRLNYLAFKVKYDFCDGMFGVNADDKVDTDQLYCTAYFKTNVIRALDREGLPY